MKRFKFLPQHDQMDCGPACLQMISRYHGKKYSLQYLRELSLLSKEGVSLYGITHCADEIGFQTMSVQISYSELINNYSGPSILHWNQNHFVVLFKIRKNLFSGKLVFYIADPGHGIIKLNESEFKENWLNNEEGVVLFLDPKEKFYKKIIEKSKDDKKISFLFNYLKPYKWQITQLLIGIIGGSLITLIFPFLTQALIDRGVRDQSLDIIKIILFGQLFLFVGAAAIEIIRNWITLFIGSHVNIQIISDFLMKLMKLPIRFFDTKMMGDFTQRINDHERIESFLTSQSLLTIFSFINLIVFSIVLAIYDIHILITFFAFTLISIIWIFIFQKKRKVLDYIRFQSRALNQDAIYEMINGMHEIKLNNFEEYKRNDWELIQVKLFEISTRILALDQYQSVGFSLINHLKNILVTFLAAREVIHGNITLGAMLSISYIIGQMNTPLNQLIGFIRSYQDAHISLDRLSEIHNHDSEEDIINDHNSIPQIFNGAKGIKIENLIFNYDGVSFKNVINDISLFIPQGKTTAIVGASGSGKTTLMKLLLKFYDPIQGNIFIDQSNLLNIPSKNWRSEVGVVMQDGYIFSDSIERNIITNEDISNNKELQSAIEVANLKEFIDELPNGLKTKIGASGNGISGGQKQRILIARAVYKNPKYLFFDEATSALDTENERIIMENLNSFIRDRTAVIIAHRLSTVKNADQIVVLDKGKIVEIGQHEELVDKKGYYFNLVKDQLELSC